MTETYSKIGNYKIIKKGGQYGILDSNDHMLLQVGYDSIFYEGGGFIITKGSKSGYIRFHEKSDKNDVNASFELSELEQEIFIPCIYDRIEPKRNGLVLCSMAHGANSSEIRKWFDYKSGKLYDNLYFLKNHGEFDEFLDTDLGAQMPHLKRAGDDFRITVPYDLTVHILYEVKVYTGGAKYFLCSEELSEKEAESLGRGYDYFLLVILESSYTFTEPKPDAVSVFENFPRTVSFWDNETEKERELLRIKENKKDERINFLESRA